MAPRKTNTTKILATKSKPLATREGHPLMVLSDAGNTLASITRLAVEGNVRDYLQDICFKGQPVRVLASKVFDGVSLVCVDPSMKKFKSLEHNYFANCILGTDDLDLVLIRGTAVPVKVNGEKWTSLNAKLTQELVNRVHSIFGDLKDGMPTPPPKVALPNHLHGRDYAKRIKEERGPDAKALHISEMSSGSAKEWKEVLTDEQRQKYIDRASEAQAKREVQMTAYQKEYPPLPRGNVTVGNMRVAMTKEWRADKAKAALTPEMEAECERRAEALNTQRAEDELRFNMAWTRAGYCPKNVRKLMADRRKKKRSGPSTRKSKAEKEVTA